MAGGAFRVSTGITAAWAPPNPTRGGAGVGGGDPPRPVPPCPRAGGGGGRAAGRRALRRGGTVSGPVGVDRQPPEVPQGLELLPRGQLAAPEAPRGAGG